MKKTTKNLKLKISVVLITMLMSQTAFANEITNSNIFKGAQNLIKDLSTGIMIISPIAGGLYLGYCFLRKKFAEDHDKTKWDKNIKVAIFCIIGVFSSSTIVTIVSHYFK